MTNNTNTEKKHKSWLEKFAKTEGPNHKGKSIKTEGSKKASKSAYKPLTDKSSLANTATPLVGAGDDLEARGQVIKRNKDVKSLAMQGNINNGISKHRMPLRCDNCYAADDCVAYKEGCVCGFKEDFQGYATRDTEEILNAIEELISEQGRRANMSLFFEKVVDGGYPGSDATGLVDNYIAHLEHLMELKRELALEASNDSNASITIKAETKGPNPNKSVDVLAQIFAPQNDESMKAEDIQVVDVEPDTNPDEMDNKLRRAEADEEAEQEAKDNGQDMPDVEVS